MISSPPYSFIQFGTSPSPCCDVVGVALPVLNGNDLQFQVISDSAPSSVDVINSTGGVISSNSGFNSLGNNVYSFTGTIDISGLLCDECFQLQIGTALSNTFKKVCDDCYTSLLEYYNDEDYASFIYCNTDFTNKVRLPFYLHSPKMAEDRTVYRKSNGAIRLTKSLITKQYTLTSDYLTEQLHDAMAVAFGHDNVNVYSSVYSGGINKNGDYSPDWQDGLLCIAPVELSVEVTPLAIKNSNCQECQDQIVCVAPTVPAFSLPDANVGNAYSHSISLSGTAPFSLSSIVKPAWMNVSVSGAGIIFSGTPSSGDAGTGIVVSFTASNACGTDSGSATINIVSAAPCEAVAITGSPALPDGYVGEYYAYSFYLTGDANFTVGTTTKPAWMNVVIDQANKKVTVNGTPTAETSGESVSIQIKNCNGSNSATFNSALTIDPAGVHFIATTFIQGDSLKDYEQANLFGGAPSAIVVLLCDSYTNTNGGTVTLNGSTFVQGDTFNIALDGSGAGNFRCDIDGVTNPGTSINAHFTIQSVSAGTISIPDIFQTSKVF